MSKSGLQNNFNEARVKKLRARVGPGEWAGSVRKSAPRFWVKGTEPTRIALSPVKKPSAKVAHKMPQGAKEICRMLVKERQCFCLLRIPEAYNPARESSVPTYFTPGLNPRLPEMGSEWDVSGLLRFEQGTKKG